MRVSPAPSSHCQHCHPPCHPTLPWEPAQTQAAKDCGYCPQSRLYGLSRLPNFPYLDCSCMTRWIWYPQRECPVWGRAPQVGRGWNAAAAVLLCVVCVCVCARECVRECVVRAMYVSLLRCVCACKCVTRLDLVSTERVPRVGKYPPGWEGLECGCCSVALRSVCVGGRCMCVCVLCALVADPYVISVKTHNTHARTHAHTHTHTHSREPTHHPPAHIHKV